MPLVAVESRRLYRQIADQLAALIAAGEFPPGSRLPPERELAHKLGVSRASVREAVICLELAGAVEVRIGTGIFVRAARDPRAADVPRSPDDAPGPFEILEARALIEGEIAALAARAIRASALAALRQTIERMRMHDDDAAQRDAADRAFHVAIAESTGNGALVLSVATLWDLRHGELWTATEQHFHNAALREKTLSDHAAIADALAEHDADAARAAMRRHLSRVAREFQRSIDATPDRTTRRTGKRPAARNPVSALK